MPARSASLFCKRHGAELIFTDPLEGSDGAIREARRLAAADPSLYYANQYNNEASWQAHYLSTGPEIWDADGWAR
jgi:S-sulfo-L-cysteine synthase (O-acetyl-L-serine-dependent)